MTFVNKVRLFHRYQERPVFFQDIQPIALHQALVQFEHQRLCPQVIYFGYLRHLFSNQLFGQDCRRRYQHLVKLLIIDPPCPALFLLDRLNYYPRFYFSSPLLNVFTHLIRQSLKSPREITQSLCPLINSGPKPGHVHLPQIGTKLRRQQRFPDLLIPLLAHQPGQEVFYPPPFQKQAVSN